MMKKLNITLLLSCLLPALFACGFDEPDGGGNEDDPGSEISATTQNITLHADECETIIALPADCQSWRLADTAVPEDWFELAPEDADGSVPTIPLKVKFNLTGIPRFAALDFDLTTKSGTSAKLNVCLTQESTAHDGRNMHLTLPSKFIAGRDLLVYSSSIHLDDEPLQLIFGDRTVDCEPCSERSVIAKIPDIEPGAYPLSIRIGDSAYDIGPTGVYSMSENDYPPVQYVPCRFNPQLLPITGIINAGAQNPHTTALLSDGTTSPVIFSDADGRLFAMQMERPTRLNGRYFAFSYLDADSELMYDDSNYSAAITKYSYSTAIVDVIGNDNCHVLPFNNINPETIKWTGYARNGNSRFIAGRNNIVSFEISEERIENVKSLGNYSVGDYPYPIGCGDMISLGNGSLLVGGKSVPVAPYSMNNSMYHFESGDASARLTDVPVYGLEALFRVVNYSRLNSSGNLYMHEMMVETMDGSAIIAADAWDNDRSAGRQYQAFCLESDTYLRPYGETGSCTALVINQNGATEENVERVVPTDPELAMNPQPYYGDYIYVKSGGKICRTRIDDYSGRAKPLNVSENAFCALGPGRALFVEITADGLRVSSFETASETTEVYYLTDCGYLGTMISF